MKWLFFLLAFLLRGTLSLSEEKDFLNTCTNYEINANIAINSKSLEILSDFLRDCTSFIRLLRGGVNLTHYSIMIDHEKADIDSATLRRFEDTFQRDISVQYTRQMFYVVGGLKNIIWFTEVSNTYWITFESNISPIVSNLTVPLKVLTRHPGRLDLKKLCQNYIVSNSNTDQCANSNILEQLLTEFQADCTILLKLLSEPDRIISLEENFLHVYEAPDLLLNRKELRRWNKILSICDVDEHRNLEYCDWEETSRIEKKVVLGNISKLDSSSYLVWVEVRRTKSWNDFSFPIRVWPKQMEKVVFGDL